MQITGGFRDESTGRIDYNIILFMLNVSLVILGYSTRDTAFAMVKLVRTVLVVISIISLFAGQNRTKFLFSNAKDLVLWGFIALNMYVLAFSLDFVRSFTRIAAWLPFLVYINFFIGYLFRNYTKEQARVKLLSIFNWSYIYPLGIMLLLGNPLLMRNIYGSDIGGFRSNVLGWSAIAFFVTAIDLLINANPSPLYKKFLMGGVVFAVLVLLSTGSRSSYLCMALSLVILVSSSKKMGFLAKLVVSLLVMLSTYYALEDPNSSINKRIQRSETQIEKGEARFEMAKIGFETMLENPTLLLTGFGYDNFRAGIAQYQGIELELASHNSYLELFLTTGLFTSTFFLLFFVLNATIRYILYDLRRFIFLPTFMIIPFFESNLNAGQFLFFPWMTFMFYYVHVGSPQVPVPVRKEGDEQTASRLPAGRHLFPQYVK